MHEDQLLAIAMELELDQPAGQHLRIDSAELLPLQPVALLTGFGYLGITPDLELSGLLLRHQVTQLG